MNLQDYQNECLEEGYVTPVNGFQQIEHNSFCGFMKNSHIEKEIRYIDWFYSTTFSKNNEFVSVDTKGIRAKTAEIVLVIEGIYGIEGIEGIKDSKEFIKVQESLVFNDLILFLEAGSKFRWCKNIVNAIKDIIRLDSILYSALFLSKKSIPQTKV